MSKQTQVAETEGTLIPYEMEKVSLYIPITAETADEPDVFVGVNGNNFLIQRGVDVEVPRYVAMIIQNSRDQEMRALMRMRELQGK